MLSSKLIGFIICFNLKINKTSIKWMTKIDLLLSGNIIRFEIFVVIINIEYSY